MSRSSVAQRPTTAVAAVPGGLIIAVLGAMAASPPRPPKGSGGSSPPPSARCCSAWRSLALRSRVDGVARPALAVAGVGMALFALAHVYTLVDVDTAILLFSVFLVVTAVALIVAGIARTARGPGPGPVRSAAVRGVAARDDPGGRGARRPAALQRDRRLGAVLGRVRAGPARQRCAGAVRRCGPGADVAAVARSAIPGSVPPFSGFRDVRIGRSARTRRPPRRPPPAPSALHWRPSAARSPGHWPPSTDGASPTAPGTRTSRA